MRLVPRVWLVPVVVVLVATRGGSVEGQRAANPERQPVTYTLSFPEPEHRWLQVDALFRDLPLRPLLLEMSAASPGRYARHGFAKNVFDLEVLDPNGRPLEFSHVAASRWEVPHHGGALHLRYRLFGDRVDGTYLGVDSTHAHINMPATLVWAHGLDERPVRLHFRQPPGRTWSLATQLFPGDDDDPLTYSAPNFQYLMDSPVEFSDFVLSRFVVPDPSDPTYVPTFRVAVHHDGDAAAVPGLVSSVEALVREMVVVFAEFPRFEPLTYTVIIDDLDNASRDAMEHRNSTVVTTSGALGAGSRTGLLETVAHEIFHVWNVERIRPRSLEPFDFTDTNISGELWLAEGVTNYYAALTMARAGLTDVRSTLNRFAQTINTVVTGPGRRHRSVVEMSRMAPFTDAAVSIDPTNWENTFISYYTWGEAIGLALDLALRDHSDGTVTLDDFMRAMWVRFGKPGGRVPGVVDRPYTHADVEEVLADVSGSPRFATDFLGRFVHGREVADYRTLLELAGVVVRSRTPDRAWLGEVSFRQGLRVAAATQHGSPLYEAGVDRDDVIQTFDDQPVSSAADIRRIVTTHRPGDVLHVTFLRRGRPVEATVTLAEDPQLDLVPIEATGQRLSAAQRAFREHWLGSQRGTQRHVSASKP